MGKTTLKPWHTRTGFRRTLTDTQSRRGTIQTPSSLGQGKLRAKSAMTRAGYSTGYHESVVTHDMYEALMQAKDNGDGTHTLPQQPRRSPHAGAIVDSGVLQHLKDHADGFRTDTALTILTGRGGSPAGHSGSGLSLKGQAGAHDLLREAVVGLAKKPAPADPGKYSEKALLTVGGSITVTSMAPGEVARDITGGTTSLNAGPGAKARWEEARTEVKRRVEALRAGLTPAEQTWVDQHARQFMKSTQKPAQPSLMATGSPASQRQSRSATRSIPRGRASSPERKPTKLGNEVSGGPYDPTPSRKKLVSPTEPVPAKVADIPLWLTAPFRELR